MIRPKIHVGDAPDRRRRPRLRLAYPLRLYRAGGPCIETKTENISCEGFFCLTEHAFLPHDKLKCEVVIPSDKEVPQLDRTLILHCLAEVVRVVPHNGDASTGVACRLSDYTIEGSGEVLRVDVLTKFA